MTERWPVLGLVGWVAGGRRRPAGSTWSSRCPRQAAWTSSAGEGIPQHRQDHKQSLATHLIRSRDPVRSTVSPRSPLNKSRTGQPHPQSRRSAPRGGSAGRVVQRLPRSPLNKSRSRPTAFTNPQVSGLLVVGGAGYSEPSQIPFTTREELYETGSTSIMMQY